jgi:GNAT superfamily N-acetyltransferase
VNVLPVQDAARKEDFIRLPFRLYQADRNWVPPLLSAERKMLDPARNPFYRHAEAAHFLAEKDGRIAGRISAIANRLHNETQGDKTGFWGYFETENDPEVAQALLDRAAAWLRERGLDRMLGPANPSLNDPCGLLVDGLAWSPFVLMTYNPGYYVKLVEEAGFTKAMDLIAYILVEADIERDKIDRVAAAIRKRADVKIRPIDTSRFERELATIQDVYNDAWEKNWGFVPMTAEEVRYMAEDLRPVLLPELAYIAELGGRPVGFAFAIPDINHILKKCRGSLLPFGWWQFLKFNLRKIPTYRLIALGVRREYHHLGLGTLFYQQYLDASAAHGYKAAELSWVLETNDLMNRAIKMMGAKPYKTYRLYERSI